MSKEGRFLTATVAFLLSLASPMAHAQSNDESGILYGSHQCFQLRSVVQKSGDAFYKAAVAFAFNDMHAEKDLEDVVASNTNSEETYQARELLTYLDMRNGRYRKALEQNKAALRERPGDTSVLNAAGLLTELAKYPQQSVIERRASSVRYRLEDGNLYLPVSVNDKHANFMVDSGANFSAMSELEAKRAGLIVHNIKLSGQDATGGDVQLRVAVARQLSIGGVKIVNVAFLVLRDDQQPFVGSPLNERGIIGLPVLVALGTIRWQQNRTFELAFPSSQKEPSKSNLCFDGADLVTEAEIKEGKLSLLVDTGASDTRLWPPFAKSFPDLVSGSSKSEITKVEGVAHETTLDSETLRELKLRLGGFDVLMRPAIILLKETTEKSRWLDGNLGMDLLNQSHVVTIDFVGMTLQLQ